MWSDPEDIETWAVSPRGAGWLFGSRVTSEVFIFAVSLTAFLMKGLSFEPFYAVQPHKQS